MKIVKIVNGNKWYIDKIDDFFVVEKLWFASEKRHVLSVELGQHKGSGINIDDVEFVEDADKSLMKDVINFEKRRNEVVNYFKYVSLDTDILKGIQMAEELRLQKEEIIKKIKKTT